MYITYHKHFFENFSFRNINLRAYEQDMQSEN